MWRKRKLSAGRVKCLRCIACVERLFSIRGLVAQVASGQPEKKVFEVRVPVQERQLGLLLEIVQQRLHVLRIAEYRLPGALAALAQRFAASGGPRMCAVTI